MIEYVKGKDLKIGSVFFIEYGCDGNYTPAVITDIKPWTTGKHIVCKYTIPFYNNQEGESYIGLNEIVKTTCLYKAIDINGNVLLIGTHTQVYNFIFHRKKDGIFTDKMEEHYNV